MAHHQHHGVEYDVQMSRSLQTRPRSTSNTHMPIISEDELLGDPEEPPDDTHKPKNFTKTRPSNAPRRQSLLTKALHTDSESHDEHPIPDSYFSHLPSVSSTCSNLSSRSNGDFTSDDGHVSPSSRASTPASPQSILNIPKLLITTNKSSRNADSSPQIVLPSSEERPKPEPTVEAQLGRKRCIKFACGGLDTNNTEKAELPPENKAPEPQKRPCALKFVCPFTTPKGAKNEPARTSRLLSPAPLAANTKTSSPRRASFHRRHRDSDTTIRMESPRTPRAQAPTSRRGRRSSNMSDLGRSDACKFHEFASEDDEVEEWTQQSGCYSSRLTVDDTLKQENHIRQLAEEADEEDAEEFRNEVEDEDDLDLDDISDDGFLTDDEDGFAESDDDEEDDNSDYEWWAPRRTRAASPYIKSPAFQPALERMYSQSSLESSDNQGSPNRRMGRYRSTTTSSNIPIRPATPELPDSTDFVCGTLDEDRPLEQAYISCMHQREAAKHRSVPQDIDPSFPTSDPELESDEDEEEDEEPVTARVVDDSDHLFVTGRPDFTDREEARGRRLSPAPPRSPPPGAKKAARAKSPAPAGMFGRYSPRRLHSPPPPTKVPSPPPSRRGSLAGDAESPDFSTFEHPFLGSRDDNVAYTASLPRSPHPFIRRRTPSTTSGRSDVADSEDEGEDTEHAKPYARGAIDIAQGLERKRLKRREKFYKHYLKKEEKKKAKRPQPGRGAQRMRQVGLECAQIRGKRMLSI